MEISVPETVFESEDPDNDEGKLPDPLESEDSD